jgi:hypothetical protein
MNIMPGLRAFSAPVYRAPASPSPPLRSDLCMGLPLVLGSRMPQTEAPRPLHACPAAG